MIRKGELRERLEGGATLDELLIFTNGQECPIFKAEEFVPGDAVLYIPDIWQNEIDTTSALTGEELEDALGMCYTGDDFIELCDGDAEKAERLFWFCDWQHPSAALPEIEEDDRRWPV